MKIALCFHGNTGFKEKLRGNNLVDLEPLDIKLPIKSIKENLVNDHETDIFIHTWSKDKKKEIIKELAPVKSVFENHKNFSSDFKDRKNATLSKYYSVEQVNKLKKEYEQKNNFRYDAVFHTRFDLVWFSKIPIEQDFKDKYLLHYLHILFILAFASSIVRPLMNIGETFAIDILPSVETVF